LTWTWLRVLKGFRGWILAWQREKGRGAKRCSGSREKGRSFLSEFTTWRSADCANAIVCFGLEDLTTYKRGKRSPLVHLTDASG
jgi:hypothetical protein